MANNIIEAVNKTLESSDKEVASVFSEVSPETASELIQTFEENSRKKKVTYNVIKCTLRSPSPLIKTFVGTYAGSSKEPDYTFWPKGLSYPSIVLETGYSESWEMLLEDQGIWSEGTGYKVSIVILVKIATPNAAGATTAKCSVTMFDQNGITRVYDEILLPRPQNRLRQVPITYSQLYREMLPQGVLAHGQTGLDLDALRDRLEHAITFEGFSIAP